MFASLMPIGLPFNPFNPFGVQVAAPAPQSVDTSAILGMERHQAMLREFDRLRENGGSQQADTMRALLEQERHNSVLRSLGGIEEAIKEQTRALRSAPDNRVAPIGGGISSTMALEVFKALDNDKDGNVSRAELDRHLGVA